MSRDEDDTGATRAATEGDVVELLIDLLVQVPVDESNASIGSVEVLHEVAGAVHHGLVVECDDGSRFHVGVVKVV